MAGELLPLLGHISSNMNNSTGFSPVFLAKMPYISFFLPREESAGALQGPHPSSGASATFPNPLYLWHVPPPADSEVVLLVTIRHLLHAFLRLSHPVKGEPW
jgi:hypothetical protein